MRRWIALLLALGVLTIGAAPAAAASLPTMWKASIPKARKTVEGPIWICAWIQIGSLWFVRCYPADE